MKKSNRRGRKHYRIELTEREKNFISGPLMQKRIWALVSEREVELFLPHTTVIGPDVTIGKGTRIWQGVTLLGKTRIGEGCEIEPWVILEDVEVEDGATVHTGAYIRQGCRIGNAEIWAGVRMYNSWLKDGVVAHSSSRIVRSIVEEGTDIDSHCLIKDAEIGEDCRVGPRATIIGKSRPRRALRRGGRTVRIQRGRSIPPGEKIISQ